MTIFEFNPAIYPRLLWIVKSDDAEFIKSKFCHRNGKELELFEEDEDNFPVCTTFRSVQEKNTGKFGVLVCIYGRMHIDHISHEAYHIASEIFRDIGAEHDIDNQEPAAYLIGWCAKCIASANESEATMIPATK